jgi:hypothetical protein
MRLCRLDDQSWFVEVQRRRIAIVHANGDVQHTIHAANDVPPRDA